MRPGDSMLITQSRIVSYAKHCFPLIDCFSKASHCSKFLVDQPIHIYPSGTYFYVYVDVNLPGVMCVIKIKDNV